MDHFFLRLQIVVPDVPEIVSVNHCCSNFANCHSQKLFFCKSFWIYILCEYCTDNLLLTLLLFQLVQLQPQQRPPLLQEEIAAAADVDAIVDRL